MRLCSPGPYPPKGQASKSKVEKTRPAEEQAVGDSHVQAARGVHGFEGSQWSIANICLSAQGRSD